MDPPFDLDNSDDETSSSLACVSPAILEQLAHLNLAGRLTRTRKVVAAGGYGDISKGRCRSQRTGTVKVAIKCLRFCLKDDIKTLFEKEIYVWSKLKHDNILPLLGFDIDTGTGYPLLVSEWMDNGSAWSYVNCHPDVNPMHLDNVLVSPSGNALICDFGCSRMIAASRSLANLSSGIKGTSRYLAPELVSSTNFQNGHTMKTDVWAFGMTVYELAVRQRPFANLSDPQAIIAIAGNERPVLPLPSPQDPFFEDLIVLGVVCSICWERSPEARPDMPTLLNMLQERRIRPWITTQTPWSQWVSSFPDMRRESSQDLLSKDENRPGELGRLLETDVRSSFSPHGSHSSASNPAASYYSLLTQALARAVRASLPGPSHTSSDGVPSYVQRQEHLFSPMNGHGLGMDPLMSSGYNYPDPAQYIPIPGEYRSANPSRKAYASQTTVPTSQGLASSGNNDMYNAWQTFMAGNAYDQ